MSASTAAVLYLVTLAVGALLWLLGVRGWAP